MIDTISINDNISLHYIPMTKIKTTSVGLYIHRRLDSESATMNALLPYVLQRGTKKLNSSEKIAHYLENLYGASLNGTVGKNGEDQILIFGTESISDKYAPEKETLTKDCVELLLGCVFEPYIIDGGFKKEYVNQEKKNIKQRIESLIDDKRLYASTRCVQEMCAGDPISIARLGRVEDLEKIDEKNLYEHYKDIITTSAIDIYICGDTDIKNISDRIKQYISGFEFKKADIPNTTLFKKENSEVNNVEESLDVTQGKLSIGFRTNIKCTDSDYYGLMVANSIYGAGAHSKLFNNVREKLSLAYYASSQLEKYKGLMIVNAGIEFDKYQAALDESLAQLDAIKKGEISELEFDSSVQSIVNALQSYYDDPHYIQSFYLGEKIANTNNTIDHVIGEVQKVTIEDVAKAASKIELDTIYFLKGKGDA